MKKLSASLLALGLVGGLSKEKATHVGMEINDSTGVVALSSLFPYVGKKVHRNGRSNNVDGRFGIQKLNIK